MQLVLDYCRFIEFKNKLTCRQSIDVLWVVFFIVGVLEIFCTSIAVIGYKRFRKKKYVVPKKMKHKRGIQTALPYEYADDFNSQVDII
jgi:hypothetical protein